MKMLACRLRNACVAANRTNMMQVRHGHGGADGVAQVKLWEKLTYFVAFPAIALGMLNVYLDEEEHKRPEYIEYDYLRIRNKKFPWGDGNKSFFHNPHCNALPGGYEDDGHH